MKILNNVFLLNFISLMQSWIFSFITPVFNVTLSFILIETILKNISDYFKVENSCSDIFVELWSFFSGIESTEFI